MTRNKVRLAYIPNDTARKTTFKKRKVGLVKKLDELTTLCDIEACCIIYSVYDPQPLVWPSIEEAHRLIMKYKSFSEVDQVKRKVNQETFTRQRIQKMEEKLRKQQRENHHKELTQIMFQSMVDPQAVLSMLDMGDYEELTRVTNQNLMEIQRMMEMRGREESSFNLHPPIQGGAGGSGTSVGTGRSGGCGGGSGQQLVLSHHEFMPTNQYGGFQSSIPGFTMPMTNMTFPPPPPPPRMAFPHLSMSFPTGNMGFSHLSTDFPLTDMTYVHPNMGMPYPSNHPMFPYYHNADMGPHDPSLH